MRRRHILACLGLFALTSAARGEATGLENLVPGDDPAYDALARLAADGLLPGLTARHFAGESEVLYTVGQIVDYVALAVAGWYPGSLGREVNAAPLRYLIWRYRRHLTARGIDSAALLADLPVPDASGPSGFMTLSGEARGGWGLSGFDGRAEWTGIATFSDRTRAGLTIGTEGTWPFLPEYQRDDIRGFFVAHDFSDHLTITAGRLSTRFGPGLNDMLWSDRARPLDSLALEWSTKLFGEPLSLRQQTGYFRDLGVSKYVTVQRIEYQPTDWCTLGAGFGLITDRSLQALASLVVPLYAVRFVAGEGRRGGEGNFLGAVDAAFRPCESISLYGQFFVDDFDFSPSPPRTAQRLGYLAGAMFTPGGLPGSQYRAEVCILPDTGTYVGQQNARQSWLRGGTILGHEYGPDSWGYRLFARQRLCESLDLSAGFEQFRQRRETPSPARTTRLDLHLRHDLDARHQLGLGWRHREFRNRGGVAGRNSVEEQFYLEARGIL